MGEESAPSSVNPERSGADLMEGMGVMVATSSSKVKDRPSIQKNAHNVGKMYIQVQCVE